MTILCIQSGLPEYEGETYIYLWGRSDKPTYVEAVKDIAERKHKTVTFHKDGTAYDWGFELVIAPEEWGL